MDKFPRPKIPDIASAASITPPTVKLISALNTGDCTASLMRALVAACTASPMPEAPINATIRYCTTKVLIALTWAGTGCGKLKR